MLGSLQLALRFSSGELLHELSSDLLLLVLACEMRTLPLGVVAALHPGGLVSVSVGLQQAKGSASGCRLAVLGRFLCFVKPAVGVLLNGRVSARCHCPDGILLMLQ